jgi:hypothetical protein
MNPRGVILVVATTLLPFLPLLLIAGPLDVVLKALARFRF